MTPDLLFKVLGDRWLRLAVLLLVLAALAHQLSLVIWQLVPAEAQAMTLQTGPVTRNQNAATARVNFQQQASTISRAFLFGQVEVEATAPVVVEEAPETRLNYKLRGTYYSHADRLSMAIIEVKPNQSRHYTVGEELEDNITLSQIESEYVLLNRYGKLERLNLEKRGNDDGNSFVSTQNETSATSATHTALLRSYKKRYTSNPMALATRFQSIPVQQDGQNIGFKLKALRGERLLERLDFEPDDVFTSVNGMSLQNPFEAMDALKSLATADRLTVTFMRNGAEQTADFEL